MSGDGYTRPVDLAQVARTVGEILTKVEAIEQRCVRIETRVSKLLVELGLNYNGTAVVDPGRLPESIPS